MLTKQEKPIKSECYYSPASGGWQAAGPLRGGGGRNGSGMEPGAAGWAERGVNPSEVVTFALHTVLLLHTDIISCMLWFMHSNKSSLILTSIRRLSAKPSLTGGRPIRPNVKGNYTSMHILQTLHCAYHCSIDAKIDELYFQRCRNISCIT